MKLKRNIHEMSEVQVLKDTWLYQYGLQEWRQNMR
jgi:hypothetical protein